ncbi:MAG TPA: hypothetical protein VKB17_04420 [Thermoleophilaceae bacterium]|nr:hypothetical protein [Thermoleophilaceae bacterium]
MSVWRHLRAIGLLPVMATLGVPALILSGSEAEMGWGAVPGWISPG